VALILIAASLSGQQSSGSISGVVQDSQGGIIPNVKVTLLNQAQGTVARELQTSGEGTFFFTPVPPGTYSVIIESAGFKKYVRTDIVLYAQDRVGLPPIILELGAVGETINVESGTVALQTVSAERSGVLTGSQMVDLGSSTRLYTDLLPTIPGFNADTQNANGLRTDQNAIAVDGTLVTDVGNNSAGGWRLNTDIIAEFKVLTNGQQAEFGRASGSNITLVTKGGTRDFHGVGYEFYRNEWMNSNTWTNNYNGLARPRNRNSTFGFNVGGPIYIPKKFNSSKEKIFFFTNWEFQRPRLFDPLVSLTVPTALERAGNFSQTRQNNLPVTIVDPANGKTPFPGNVIPQNRWNQYGLQLMNVFPLPNKLGVDPGYNYQYQFAGTDSRNDRTYRIDYNITPKWKFFFRLLTNHQDLNQSAGLNVNNTIGIGAFFSGRGTISGAGNLTTILTPTLTNEFNYGNTRNWLPNVPATDSKYLRANSGVTLPMLYPDADKLAGLVPNMSFGAEVANAPTIYIAGMPYDNENPTANITDNVAKVFARHTLKAGIYIETSSKRQTASELNNGRINFSTDSSNPGDSGWDYSNMLLGNYQTFEQSNAYVKGEYYYRSFEWYVQDNWKLRNNLTLDYGMRFSNLQPWIEKKDQISSFQASTYNPKQAVVLYQPTLVNGVRSSLNPITGQTGAAALIGAIVPNSGNIYNGIVTPATSTNGRGMVDGQGILMGPRLGLAWSPLGADKNLVVRMGGGVFFERIQGNMIFNQINYPPELVTPKMYYGNLSTVAGSAGTLFPLNVAGLSPEGKIPTVYNYNLSVQRELPGKIKLDVGYVGMQNRHELARAPFNEAPFGAAWKPQNQDPARCPTLSTCKMNGDNALPVDFLRPYIGYSGASGGVAQSGLGGGGFIATFGSSANYNALQVSAQRSATKDLTIGAAYTWSKVLGTDADYSFVGNPIDHRKADYAPLTYDRTQTLVLNYLYNVPGIPKQSALDNPVTRLIANNWQISGITSFAVGEPVAIGGSAVTALGTYSVQGVGGTTLNQEITGNAGWSPRPVLTCNPNQSRGSQTLYAFINTSCFSPAAVGSTGMDSTLRPIRGPGVNNWNLSLFKKMPLGSSEQRYLQFRVEAYNAFNHTQWGGVAASNYIPAGLNITPTFNAAGQITNLPNALGGGGGRFGFGALNAVRPPRSFQLGAKIYF
jgi:hypothetical protein